MNHPIEGKLLRTMAVSLEHHLAGLGVKVNLRQHGPRHGEPFSKRPEGRARRMARRQAIARKHEWLES